VGDGSPLPLEVLEGLRVAMVCGIGHPRGLKATLDTLGARVVQSLFFSDHYWYTPQDAARIRACLPDVDAVITTEKDAWKLREVGMGEGPVWALRADLEVEEDLLLAYVDRALGAARERL
jgi:tetraacyldisaccharide-1-P 4'-kinase